MKLINEDFTKVLEQLNNIDGVHARVTNEPSPMLVVVSDQFKNLNNAERVNLIMDKLMLVLLHGGLGVFDLRTKEEDLN